MEDTSQLVRKGPCADCGSSDACAVYDDGHTHCFSCGQHRSGDNTATHTPRVKMSDEFLRGDVRAIPARGLNEATCQKFGYRVGSSSRGSVQIAEYRDEDGTTVAQHVRTSTKDFFWLGDAKAAGLWGKHLWQEGGKRMVVTEGEIDAMSLCQAFGLSWGVVSLPSGAQGAKKAIQRDLEWLSSFDEVVLCFDQDERGRAAAAECAPLFAPGKCRIAELPLKDASDMTKAGRIKELVSAIYQARVYRPGGVINGSELWERITAKLEPGLPYPWAGLTEKTYGQRRGTLTTWTAGTGAGKSTAVAQVAYDLAFRHGLRVGYVALEEDVGRAGQRFISHHLGKLCHLPGVVSEDEMRVAFDATLGTGRVWLLDHFGSSDSETLISKLRYLAKGCECEALILDHVSIAVSGMEVDGDERRVIDHLMTALRTLTEETGVKMHVISHLRRTKGDKGHEDGAEVSLSHLRGSGAIAQLSDVVIALERDLSGDTQVTVKVLKNRVSGDTGLACTLDYDKTTGKLTEVFEAATAFGDDDERDF